jgi:hypothetical protein
VISLSDAQLRTVMPAAGALDQPGQALDHSPSRALTDLYRPIFCWCWPPRPLALGGGLWCVQTGRALGSIHDGASQRTSSHG